MTWLTDTPQKCPHLDSGHHFISLYHFIVAFPTVNLGANMSSWLELGSGGFSQFDVTTQGNVCISVKVPPSVRNNHFTDSIMKWGSWREVKWSEAIFLFFSFYVGGVALKSLIFFNSSFFPLLFWYFACVAKCKRKANFRLLNAILFFFFSTKLKTKPDVFFASTWTSC